MPFPYKAHSNLVEHSSREPGSLKSQYRALMLSYTLDKEFKTIDGIFL